MSTQMLAEGEILREARRVLRRLSVEGAVLTPMGDGFALVGTGRGGVRKPVLRVAAPVVLAFRRRDWLAQDPADAAQYILSDAGLGWVRRALAAEAPFLAQHQIIRERTITHEGREVNVTVNEAESPLGWLFRRRGPDGRTLINTAQFEAGERLRADFTRAQLMPRMGVDLSAPVVAGRRGGKSGGIAETALAAKQRLKRALDAVGPGLSDLLLDVCCYLTGLEDAEKQHGWPQRSAKVVLQIALDRLVAHYGMAITGTGSRLRAWSAEEEEARAS